MQVENEIIEMDKRWMDFRDFKVEDFVGWLTGIESHIDAGIALNKDLFFAIGDLVLNGGYKLYKEIPND